MALAPAAIQLLQDLTVLLRSQVRICAVQCLAVVVLAAVAGVLPKRPNAIAPQNF